MDAAEEIAALRRAEAWAQRAGEEIDRLQWALTGIDDRLVVLAALRGSSWAKLPRGWRSAGMLQIAPDTRPELIPQQWHGEVAVSVALARVIVAGDVVVPARLQKAG